LNEYHESNIVQFIKFTRSQRALSIRTINGTFKEIEKSHLKHETTLTVDEVIDLLNELWEYAKEEIDQELTHQSHTYVLLLRQLFLQAEHWHLKMNADISELENKYLINDNL
jgi:leucine zipper transcription factor-like protein 1